MTTTRLKQMLATLLALSTFLFGSSTFGQEPIKIRIAYPSGINAIYPIVAERAGLAKKNGLDAEYLSFQNGPPMMEALAAGKVDAIVTSLIPITNYLSKQPDKLVVVAQLGYSSHSLLVPKDSPARDIGALKGKKIAVSFGTDSYADLLIALKDVNLTTADVQLVNTPPNELPGILGQNLVDAALIREPQAQRVQEQFSARPIHKWPHHYLTVLSTDYLKKYPEAKERYLATLRDAVLYTSQNPAQASEWFAEKLRIDASFVKKAPNEDPAFLNLTDIRDVNIEITPVIQQRNEQRVKKLLDIGVLKQPVRLLYNVEN